MSNYIELISLSSRITDDIQSETFPLDSLQLAKKLGISVRNSQEYAEDWRGKRAPIRLKDAFLIASDSGYTIYYNENNNSYNFYIAHEIAHYLFKHNNDSARQENDANLLAMLLIAPPKRLKQKTHKTCQSLASLCKISVAMAEQYDTWLFQNDVNYEKETWAEKFKSHLCCNKCKYQIALLLVAILLTTSTIYGYRRQLNTTEKTMTNPAMSQTVTSKKADTIVYITAKGKKYHLPSCRFIKNRKDVKKLTVQEAEDKGYKPCEICHPDIQK